ncbi:hypothetical protein [Bacillus sp. AFS017274]|uniref:hypothetical protein n=1 Tax=Bacillus sp. AFS017274 TaxID=2033488 RepID=UPI0011556645|nr:hypothetical protein [Bacillus sp. AFS017274]
MSNLIHQRIIDMLSTSDEQVKKLAQGILEDCERASVNEVTTKYISNIRKYAEGEKHETKMD